MSYTCEDARKDIEFVFSDEEGEFGEKIEASLRFWLHTAEPKPDGGKKIICNECWNYYQKLDEEYESRQKAG